MAAFRKNNFPLRSADKNRSKKKGNRWLALAFPGVFFVVGIAVFVVVSVLPALRWLDARDWQPVPASIEAVDLVTHRGSDSTTYSVKGRYQYQAGGQNYFSDDITLYRGSDNIGSYWQDLYQRLSYEQRSGTAMAWVNPENPAEAVLDRSYRFPQLLFGLIFMGMFCGISALLMWGMLRAQNQDDETQKLIAGDAQAAGISSDNKAAFIVLMGMGVLFLLFGVPVSVLALSDGLAKGEYAVLLVLIFPLVGGGLFFHGYRQLALWRRIGKTPFFPDPLPGCAGGQVGGRFRVSSGHFGALPEAELRCVHVYSTGSGKNSSTHRDILWHAEQQVYTAGNELRVLFDVPASAPVSGAPGFRGSVHWELHCQGELRLTSGQVLPFSRQWTLPVVAGDASAQWQPLSAELERRQSRQRQQAEASASEQIHQSTENTGVLHLTSRRGRHTKVALGLLLFGAVFGGAGIFLFTQAAREGGMLWLMATVFFTVGTLLFLYALFWLGRGLEAHIEAGRVTAVRSWFGKVLYQRSAMLRGPDQLDTKESMTVTSSGGARQEFFRLEARADGKRITLAEGIIGRDAAEALKNRVGQVLTRSLDEELGQG